MLRSREERGRIIKLFRTNSKLATQKEVAEKSGHSKRTIERSEKGQVTNVETLEDICQALGWSAHIALFKPGALAATEKDLKKLESYLVDS